MLNIAALLLLAVTGAFVATPPAHAQALKVGFTDHELLIVNMSEYQQVQEQLQGEYTTSQQDLQAAMQDYQERLDRYQKQQALLSPERRQEREQELMQLQGEIQQSAMQAEQQLAAREAELLRPLVERVRSAIETVAEAQSIDLVIREPSILYINEDKIVDITLAVASELGIEVDETDGTATSGASN